MTMPHERARALVWAGGFLIELARDEALPITVRRRAVAIARHFPTAGEVMLAASFSENGLDNGLNLAAPEKGKMWQWTAHMRFLPIPRGLTGPSRRTCVVRAWIIGLK